MQEQGGAGPQGITTVPGYLDVGQRPTSGPVPAGNTTITAAYVGDGRPARLDGVLLQPEIEWVTLGGSGGGQALLRSYASGPRHQVVKLGSGSVTAHSYDAQGRPLGTAKARGGRSSAGGRGRLHRRDDELSRRGGRPTAVRAIPRGTGTAMSALKVGLIGTGSVSRSHAPHWVSLGAEVSVFSLAGRGGTGRRVRADGRAHPGRRCSTRSTSSTSARRPTTHAEVALAAIAAGRHVLCEKPLGRTLEEAKKVAAAAREAGVQVYPAHVVRYFPEYETLHRAVEDGRIGRPAVLRFSRGGSGPTTDWFFDDAESGGIILDLMIHDLDQARRVAGEVVRVFAVQNPPTVDGQVPRNVAAHITLVHENGAISHICTESGARPAWTSPPRSTWPVSRPRSVSTIAAPGPYWRTWPTPSGSCPTCRPLWRRRALT